MGCASLVGVAGLGVSALATTEWGIHQHHIEEVGRPLEQAAVGLVAGEGVAVPDVGLVDAVEDEVGQGDGVDQVLLLTPVEGGGAQLLQLAGGGGPAQLLPHMLVGLGEEAAGAAARVVDRLAQLGGHGLYHGADDLPRGEELTTVVVLLPHAQQQALVGLGQQEDVSGVGGLVADAVDGVEDVEEVLLGVNADRLDGLHDLADDALARGGILPLG